MNRLDYARFYSQEKGWAVFPLQNTGKFPMIAFPHDQGDPCKGECGFDGHGFHDATTNIKRIEDWWTKYPNAGIGIATGEVSGIFVLDTDVKYNGDFSLKTLTDKYGELPNTPVAVTGTGGKHYIFGWPGVDLRNSASKLGKGLDTRANGGYIAAAPSIHDNGKPYKWLNAPSQIPTSLAPDWLIWLLQEQVAAQTKTEQGTPFPEGSRNASLASMAGSMRRKGFSHAAIFDALMRENEERCIPPLPEKEVQAIAASIARYEPTAEPKPKAEPEKEAPKEKLVDVSARGGHISLAWDEFEQEVKKRAADPREVWGIPYAFPYLSKLTGGKQPGELIVLAGEPKIGKSYWALQDTLHTAINDVPCFYWSGEMRRKQVVRRLTAMLGVDSRRSRTGFMQQEDWAKLNDARAMLYNIPLFLDDRALAIHELRALLERVQGEHGIQQFVIDYSAKVFAPGKDDNEKSARISDEVKGICNDLGLAGIMINSMNKMGFDNPTTGKANVRGSGQVIHDADVVYLLTAYKQTDDLEEQSAIKPADYDRTVSLHVAAGRELDHRLPGGVIQYMRESTTPKFKEMKNTLP